MGTLALRPALPVRPRSASKHGLRGLREHLSRREHERSWRIVGTATAIAVALFSVSVPMLGDPTGRLNALDASPTVSISPNAPHAWFRDFELTPAIMGPAFEIDAITSIEEDASAIVMPELPVTAIPIVSSQGGPSPG